MAQSGFTPISLYYSSTGAAVPSAGNLVAGELALNTNDGKLYYKNSSGVVTLLAGATSGPAGGSTTQVQYNNAGVLAGITGATTNGTALTLVAPVLGTPASGTVTNLTGTASININGTVGATTPATAAFTSVTSTVTAANNLILNRTDNGPALVIQTNGVNKGTIGGSGANLVFSGPNGASGAGEIQLTTTGLAVTGTLSATGTLSGGTSGTGYSFSGSAAAGSLTLDSSGNLGLGVTPSAWASGSKAIEIGTKGSAIWNLNQSNTSFTCNAYYDTAYKYGGTGLASSYQQAAGIHYWYTASSGTAGNPITFTQAMTLDASGNLGLGVTAPLNRLDARAASAVIANYQTIQASSTDSAAIDLGGGIGLGGYYSGTAAYAVFGDIVGRKENGTGGNFSGYLAFGTNNNSTGIVERARIDSSGNLLVGRTTTANTTVGSGLYASGIIASCQSASTNANTAYDLYSTGAAAYRFYVGMGGTIYATATSITAISDASLKTNVRDLETGLTEVMALQPRRFDWINGDAANVAGFIAQEVKQVLPDLVENYQYNDEETKLGLKMGDILPTLVKAIQEQQAIITALTTRITALEAK